MRLCAGQPVEINTDYGLIPGLLTAVELRSTETILEVETHRARYQISVPGDWDGQ